MRSALQERKKGSKKLPIANRNALQARIEAAIKAISHAGQLAFAAKPDIAAKFRDLVPSNSSRTAKKKSPTV